MKKGLIILLALFSLSFVSAYYGGYYGGGFSLSDLLNEIDSETMLLGVTFIISFALVNLSLQRVFKDNKPVAGVVAFCIALLIAWGINKSGFDLEDIFYSIGLSSDFLSSVLPLLVIGGFIFAMVKWQGNGFIGIGVFMLAGVFFVEERGILILLAAASIALGFAINKWLPKKKKNNP